MSWWTDIRDAVVGVVEAPFKIVTAPIEEIWDIAHGQSVGSALGDMFKKEIGAIGTIALGPTTTFFQTEHGQELLHNDFLNKVSFGYAEDFAGTVHGLKTLKDDGNASTDDLRSGAKWLTKTGAIAGGAALAQAAPTLSIAGHTVTFQEGLSAVGIGAGLAKGDASQLAASLGIDGLDNLKSGADTVNNFFQPSTPDQGPQAVPAPRAPSPPYVSEQASTTPGARALASSPSEGGTSNSILLLGAGAAALLLLSRKHRG